MRVIVIFGCPLGILYSCILCSQQTDKVQVATSRCLLPDWALRGNMPVLHVCALWVDMEILLHCRTPEKSSLHGPYHLGLIHRLHFRIDGTFLVCVGKDCPCTLFVLTFFCLSDKKTLLYLCKWDVCLTVYPVKHTIKIQWLYSLTLYNFFTWNSLPFAC